MTDDQTRADFSNALIQLLDNTSPLLDAADGMRADMERRGWSPTAAEQASLSWLLEAQRYLWQQFQKAGAA